MLTCQRFARVLMEEWNKDANEDGHGLGEDENGIWQGL